MADSTIKIKTQIDIKQAQVQLTTLENSMRKASEKADGLRAAMKKLEDSKFKNGEYDGLAKQLKEAQSQLSALVAQRDRLKKSGLGGSTAYSIMGEDIKTLENTIQSISGKMQDIYNNNVKKYDSYKSKLKETENEIEILTKKEEIAADKAKLAAEKGKKAMGGMKKVVESAASSFVQFASKIKTILAAVLVFNVLRKALNGVKNGIKEGFSNMAENFTPFKQQVDSLNASLLTLKNTLAAAFQPIVSSVIPYIQKMVEWLTNAINMVGQFIAAIMGRTTYTKAVKQSAKAAGASAKATKKEAEALEDAKEAAEGYLSPIDEINKFQTNKNTGANGADIPDADGGGAGGVAQMFTEAPIDSKILDWLDQMKQKLAPILDYMEQLWGMFKQGFFDGLGDWQTRWEDIKASIASIKDSLIDIWTDPAVLASADKWAKSLMYMLGSLVGSIASIGLTIADNLVGGIALYLEQNKDRIKQYLINMFDIWADINNMLAEFFQSFAYVFEAFASQDGKQTTANIIGIFSDAFMGATELVSRFAKDVINLITQPFIDNKEGFRTALEGFLNILSIVTGTVKDAIDQTFAKLNEVYEEHISPFFQSFTDGISEIIGSLLEFWNNNLQPMLAEWATEFDELWNSHLQPFVNSVIEFFGSIIDLVKALWENILQPFINWVVNEILPLVLPVLDRIWTTVKQVFSDIADVLADIVNVFKGVIDLITALVNGDWQGVWDACKNIVKNIFDAIVDIIKGVFNIILNLLGTFFTAIVAAITAVGKTIIDGIIAIFNAIKDRIVAFFDWIKEKISGGLSSAKEAWDAGWEHFTGKVKEVWDSIVGTVKDAIESILELINNAKQKWNDLKSSVSSKFSSFGFGGGFSFSMPSIPKFATGGVIPTGVGKHLAMVGDNNHETEVVSPLSTIKQAMSEVMGTNGGSTVVKLYLDGEQVAESVVKAGKLNQMATGENMFAF